MGGRSVAEAEVRVALDVLTDLGQELLKSSGLAGLNRDYNRQRILFHLKPSVKGNSRVASWNSCDQRTKLSFLTFFETMLTSYTDLSYLRSLLSPSRSATYACIQGSQLRAAGFVFPLEFPNDAQLLKEKEDTIDHVQLIPAVKSVMAKGGIDADRLTCVPLVSALVR
jgi:hypothetical protein